MGDDRDFTVDRLADRPPGFEESDPYEGIDVSELPEWWQEAIEEFEEHGLRPYRPSRFTDGEYVPEVVSRLESEFDVPIYVMGINVSFGDDWSVVVDGTQVAAIGRRRDTVGYTVFEMDSAEFEAIVRDAMEGS